MKIPIGLILSLICIIFMQSTAVAKTTIAVIGKTKNDSFYIDSFKGCQEFAKNQKEDEIECIYDGPLDYQNARSQGNLVRAIIEKNVDGILVSTTDSKYLVDNALKLAKEKNIPVMTFDSDLLPEHQRYRLAYVGTNNYGFGVALGTYAKKYKRPGTTEICIQSGSQTTPNLNDRIRGVRFALSGKNDNKKLNGENGWIEHKRCPFYSLGKKPQALSQLKYISSLIDPPIFLAVAGFAQFSPDYIKEMTPFKHRILARDLIIISADSEPIQHKALKENLSTLNLGQRPFEMGRYGAQLLFNFIKYKKRPSKKINYLGFSYCALENENTCELN